MNWLKVNKSSSLPSPEENKSQKVKNLDLFSSLQLNKQGKVLHDKFKCNASVLYVRKKLRKFSGLRAY